ncbi:metal-sulfur cluster assembly factor [Actinoplanes sp. NPDC049802]|uniref:metal-sulfur cluster assembly factor n=1 Tax=Actinoplanes sp. NPDC049802 TaxID=3154742 RepID=UPI0033EFBB45
MGESAIADQITEALRDVLEPEIGVNVVDLGLLYGVRTDDGEIAVTMTQTSPWCPDADLLRAQVHQALDGLGLNHTISVTWARKPVWGPERITPDGLDQLRALGLNL